MAYDIFYKFNMKVLDVFEFNLNLIHEFIKKTLSSCLYKVFYPAGKLVSVSF